jgi:hypothetical protein
MGEQVIKAERVGVESLADVIDAAGAQDVEREGAQAGDDAGSAPDAAGILAERPVTHMVVAVLGAPVPAHGSGPSLGVERDLAGVVGHLMPWSPQAGAGIAAQGAAGHAHDAGDEGPPVGIKPVRRGEDLDAAMLLTTVGMTVDGGEVISRDLDGAQAGQALKQARLVVLDPNQQGVAGRGRGGEGFFDRAARRR